MRRLLIALCAVTFTIIATAANSGQQASPAAVPPAATVTLTTRPSPPVGGNNEFIVTVAKPDKKPLVGADVSVTLVMPAMPSMKMAEMKNTIALKPVSEKPADAGKYSGKGQVLMAGTWNVTVTVKVDGKDFAGKKLTITAK